MTARYVVGIDLGTTNSAVGYIDTAEEEPQIRTFPILQVVAPGVFEPRPTLPSFLYVGSSTEFAPSAFALPWTDAGSTVATGEFARTHGWQVPQRLVSSA